jgi:hypothetical protein
MTWRNRMANRWPNDYFRKNHYARRCIFWVLFLALSLCLINPLESRESRTLDPSGVWKSLHGVLSLMLTGDALSFSYSAVFGATAHLCDGVGVAALVADHEYHYVDEQGTVAFIIGENGVKMRTVTGIASFCGANWPGEDFTREGYTSVERCRVSDAKAHFYAVRRTPPLKRKAYVIQGDQVEVVPACFEGGDAWVLARFKGPKAITVGLLQKNALDCLK